MAKDLYIIRKYVMAKTAKEAIEKEKNNEVTDVWIDEDWKKEKIVKSKSIGYK